MTPFIDALKRNWSLELNVTALRRIKAESGIDLAGIFTDGTILQRLYLDPVVIADILWGFCKPQVEAKKLTREDFDNALHGDCLVEARKAIMGEIVNFTPDLEDRANLQGLLEATDKSLGAAKKLLKEKIANGQITAVLDQALTESTNSSGPAPESSE